MYRWETQPLIDLALPEAVLILSREIGLHVRDVLNGITAFVLEYQEQQPPRTTITTFAASAANDLSKHIDVNLN